MPAIAIDASVACCKYLWANLKASPQLFGDTRFLWGSAGAEVSGSATSLGLGEAVERPPRVRLATLSKDGHLSLLKSDGNGFCDMMASERQLLNKSEPIFWIEARTVSKEEEAEWRTLVLSIAARWGKMVLFDNFGFAIAAGDTQDLVDRADDLMAYARRQRERSNYQPTLYYLEIALFPQRFEDVFDEFRQSLSELQD